MTDKAVVSIEAEARTEGAARGFDRMRKSVGGAKGEVEKLDGRLARLEGGMDRVSAGIGKVTKIMGAAGLVGIAVTAVGKIDDLAQRSLKLSNVMGNLPFSIDKAQAAVGRLVTRFELAQAAITANRFGLAQTGDQFAELATIASKLGQSIGLDATKSIGDLTTALSRQSPMILDNLGITLKISEANEAYALTLGKSASALTDAEKKQAFINEALRRGREAAADVTIEVGGMAGAWLKTKTAIVDFFDASVSARKELTESRNEAKLYATRLAAMGKTQEDVVGTTGQLTVENLKFRDEMERLDLRVDLVSRSMKEYDKILGERGLLRTYKEIIEESDGVVLALNEISAAAANGESFLASATGLLGGATGASQDARRKSRQLDTLGLTEPGGKKGRGGRKDDRSLLERELEAFDPMTGGDQAFDDAFGDVAPAIDPFSPEEEQRQVKRTREIELAKAQAKLEAKLESQELLRAEGVDELTLIQMEHDAQAAHLEFLKTQTKDEVQLERIKSAERKEAHSALMKQMAERERRERQTWQISMSLAKQSVATTVYVANSVAQAYDAGAKAKFYIQGIEATILAVLSEADALRAFASYDYAGGIQHQLAMAAYTATAAMAFDEAGSSGGSTSEGRSANVPDYGSRGFYNTGSGGGGGGGGGAMPSTTPITPGEEEAVANAPGGASGGGGANAGGGTVVVNMPNAMLLESSEEAGIKIDRATRYARERAGGTV